MRVTGAGPRSRPRPTACRGRLGRGVLGRLPADDLGLDRGCDPLARRHRSAPPGSDRDRRARARVCRRDVAFTGWVALSNLWTPSVTSTMHEVQRDLAYTGVIAAGLLLVRSRSTPHLLGGVLVGIVADSLYGLATRVLPDRFGGFDSTSFAYRLSAPITYWNGLGIFATIGFLLALGFAARSRHLVDPRSGCGDLAASRGDDLLHLQQGGLVRARPRTDRRDRCRPSAVAADRGHACSRALTAVAILEVRRQPGLVTVGATLEQATHDGHRLVPVLLALGAASGLVALAAGIIERRVRFPRSVRVAFAVVLLVSACRGSRGNLAHGRFADHAREARVACFPGHIECGGERQCRSAPHLALGRRAYPALACLLARLRARADPRPGRRNVLGILGPLSHHSE